MTRNLRYRTAARVSALLVCLLPLQGATAIDALLEQTNAMVTRDAQGRITAVNFRSSLITDADL